MGNNVEYRLLWWNVGGASRARHYTGRGISGLLGGGGIVELVIIIKFTKHSPTKTVKADLEVFELDHEEPPS
jgi:hypothetical protein